MDTEHQLEALLDRWHEAQDHGESVTPEELCRDCAPLLPEMEQRIKILRRFNGLRTNDDAPTAEKRPALTDTLAEPPPSTGITPLAAQPSALPALGQEFGGYRIVAVLGQGGMGRVYRAFEAELRRDVALKVMMPEAAAKPQARQRFLREARAMAAVQNDYVVPIYAVGEVNGVPFLAMPLLAGESLAARLNRDSLLPPDELRRLGREAAEGLSAAHAKGLIHRDVKPDNIWLEAGTQRVKLLDFGLARALDAADGLTQERTLLGTPAFMSPEQANGEPLDARTDLFSLGSVLYECATGKRAFAGKTLTATLVAVAEHQPPTAHGVNPSVAVELSDLIGWMMQKKAKDRPKSALEVVSAILSIESGTKKELRSGQSATKSIESIPHRRRKFTIGCSVTIALGAVLFVVSIRALIQYQRDNQATVGKGSETAKPPIPGTLNAKLDLRVWKKDNPSRGLPIEDALALPLQAGDWMRVEAETNRPAFLYVIYVDAKGEASPLFPWRKYDWDDHPVEVKQSRLHLPEDPLKDASPLTPGPSGIESVLVLARDEPLSAAEIGRLRGLFAQPPAQGKFDPLRGAVWLGAEERFGNAQDRARPDQDQSGTVLDPVERMRRLVRGELKGLAGDVRGVCYPFQGQ